MMKLPSSLAMVVEMRRLMLIILLEGEIVRRSGDGVILVYARTS